MPRNVIARMADRFEPVEEARITVQMRRESPHPAQGTCPHHRAAFRCKRPDRKRPDLLKAYQCPDCDLVAVNGEYRPALEWFRTKVEEKRRALLLSS